MLSDFKIITPTTESEMQAYYDIRFSELREPWGQPVGSERDSIDNECVHRMIISKSVFIGVVCLQYNDISQAQIRYMAVKREYQGQGFGKLLIDDLEKIAKENSVKEIILQSREVAVDFYKSLGYQLEKKTYLLFNDIQHFLMRKYL